ncbi:spermidine synthase [Rhodovibrionaceae bacterium A322]
MSLLFEELDYRPTPIGDLSLRRRRDLKLGKDVIEIKLGEEFLMSSHFTASEIALAELGLKDLLPGTPLDVIVGGLGLGYTAQAVLEQDQVASLRVIDALQPVIDWHESGLLPLGPGLTSDPRCHFQLGDFFALAQSEEGFQAAEPGRKYHAILVDIDHSPEQWLDPNNAPFYQPEGLAKVKQHLHPGGVFGLWSNDKPEADFTARLEAVFGRASAEPVVFYNPIQDCDFTQTVYLAWV